MRKFNMGTLAAKTVNAAEKAAEIAKEKAAVVAAATKEKGAEAKATVPSMKKAVKSVWTNQVDAYKAVRDGDVVVREGDSWVVMGELTA